MSHSPNRPAARPAGRRLGLRPRRPHRRERRSASVRTRRRVLLWVQVAIIAVICVAWIYPLLWVVSVSFKDQAEVFSGGLSLIPDRWSLDSYERAWEVGGFSDYLLNSFLVTAGTVVLVVARCAMAGYVIARYNFPGKRIFVVLLVATLFVPVGLTVIPVTELSDSLGLLNSRWGLVLALSGTGQVAGVLLYAGYFRSVPRELEEAAMLDGAGFVRTFTKVMLPIARPVTATVAVMTFLFAWSNFFLPLVFTLSRPELRTLSVGMLAFRSENSIDWPGLAAAGTISLLPVVIVFILLQRHFIDGVAGAVKS
ncbi:carbohydrate ABC transporter permease [Streptomyces sp. NBC_01808]|uniref:carbohydrate ABC transporter permease n=1 Tax=Streptomyces sp. NBC_01808 TaxID=2975947 RepID=UPI002DDB4585|nr:carbohydrate ABC transporter permease [Streptomyces sp. NBC_01808]WSA40250.1 carbohydrate ABC transporter permease [Streptomyces sp. NBC_01808]